MSPTIHSVVGKIRIEPMLDAGSRSDDSSLGLLLGSLAHQQMLSEWKDRAPRPIRLVSTRRISGSLSEETGGAVRADLARLLDDLQAEYDQLEETQ
jgi:hypothetical protein